MRRSAANGKTHSLRAFEPVEIIRELMRFDAPPRIPPAKDCRLRPHTLWSRRFAGRFGRSGRLGRSQVVRQRILIPPFPGSNPGAPASQPVSGLYRTSACRKYSRYFRALAPESRSPCGEDCSGSAVIGDFGRAVSDLEFSISKLCSPRLSSHLAATGSRVWWGVETEHRRSAVQCPRAMVSSTDRRNTF